MFPTDLKDTIQAVPVPLYSRGNDQMAWKYSSKGGFDLKSAYVLANNLLGAETFSGSGFGVLSPCLGFKISCGDACIIALVLERLWQEEACLLIPPALCVM